ncbi:MAG: glycerate kinase [Actinobacteria bacterium]|nr:glycerate kinase [Actinomycetota bacterium]
MGGDEGREVDVDASAGHVLVACDKFKGTLTAPEVADLVEQGLRRAAPSVPVRSVPVADGGDGTLDALRAAGLSSVPLRVSGPTGEPVDTSYVADAGTAVVELADACGLQHLPGHELAPLTASSYGLGEAVRAALDAGYRRIVIGAGGSASSDGGAGMLSALGAVLTDADGRELVRGGGALTDLAHLDLSGLHPALAAAELVLACDVVNPLLGPSGAVAVYGGQKGAAGAVAAQLEAGLERWAAVVEQVTGAQAADQPGAGAAGGVGFGALAVLGATARSGVDLVLDLVGFADLLVGARLVITGEGALDVQTLAGKAPVGVARAAAGVTTVAVCGRSELTPDEVRHAGFAQVYALTEIEPDRERCLREAGPLLRRLSAVIAGTWLADPRPAGTR